MTHPVLRRRGRSCGRRLLCAFLICASSAVAQPRPEGEQVAQVRTLDRASVAQLAASQAPAVQLSASRVEEARAARTGAGILARSNPDITLFAGPRWSSQLSTTDYYVALSVPFDLSGAPSLRASSAERNARLADAEAVLTVRRAVSEALDVWARARAAIDRAALEAARADADDELLRAARVRRAAGLVGDGEIALVVATRAQSVARRRSAQGERDALLIDLRSRLGLASHERVNIAGDLAPADLPPLAQLAARLPSAASALRNRAAIDAASADATLQARVAIPEPRLNAVTGKDSERYAHVGIDVPLPLFQRNQTNRAVSDARLRSAQIEQALQARSTRAELEAAYTSYLAAHDAFRELDAAGPAVEDAEHLAVRGFELGQSTLLEVLAVRRETAQARAARLDAMLAYARAAIAVELISGPAQ